MTSKYQTNILCAFGLGPVPTGDPLYFGFFCWNMFRYWINDASIITKDAVVASNASYKNFIW